jgi:hypothetical protein
MMEYAVREFKSKVEAKKAQINRADMLKKVNYSPLAH